MKIGLCVDGSVCSERERRVKRRERSRSQIKSTWTPSGWIELHPRALICLTTVKKKMETNVI